jgi:hypothetical protein
VIERIVDHLPVGGIVSQGDHATIDARTYNLQVTVEDRARILAEVGAALRPVLEHMQSRITQLERDNRVLRDTLTPARAGPLQPRPCPQEAPLWGLHTLVETRALKVGSPSSQAPPAASCPAPAPASSVHPGAAFYRALRGS